MRLLNARSEELVEFVGAGVPAYAILSHTWGKDEVTLDCLKSGQYSGKAGYRKIRYTLDQAVKDGLEWAWVDTCCIDKTSSAELSEAINSMFVWYQGSRICYAYLDDITYPPEHDRAAIASALAQAAELHPPLMNILNQDYSILAFSRWFRRGWTLQELVGPDKLFFFDRKWNMIAARSDLSAQLEHITGIPQELLQDREMYSIWMSLGERLEEYCIAQREGAAASFRRLQEEILKISDDLSMLGWSTAAPSSYQEGAASFRPWIREGIMRVRDHPSVLGRQWPGMAWGGEGSNVLASSPSAFSSCRNLTLTQSGACSLFTGEVTPSNVALRVKARILHVELAETKADSEPMMPCLILPCRAKGDMSKVLALKLVGLGSLAERSIKLQTGRGTTEYVCLGGGDRTGWVDSFDALYQSREQSIVIRKVRRNGHALLESLEPPRVPTRYMWIRPVGAFDRNRPRVVRAQPEPHWDEANLVFDFQQALGGDYEELRGSDVAICGSIMLQDPDVRVIFRYNPHAHQQNAYSSAYRYTLAPYVDEDLSSAAKILRRPKHSSKLANGNTVTLRFQIKDIFGYQVAILSIEISRPGDPS